MRFTFLITFELSQFVTSNFNSSRFVTSQKKTPIPFRRLKLDGSLHNPDDCLDFMIYKPPNRVYIYNWFILPDYFIEVYCEKWFSYPKVFISIIIIALILVFPQHAYKEYATHAAYLDNIWKNWKGEYHSICRCQENSVYLCYFWLVYNIYIW